MIILLKKLTSLFLIYSVVIQVSVAAECDSSLDAYLPKVKIPEIGIAVEKNSFFCFDESTNTNPEAKEQFLKLKKKNVFNANNCVIDDLFDNETDQEIAALMLLSTKLKLKIYATESPRSVFMTNSDNKDFIDKAIKESAISDTNLSEKDKMQIAAAAVSSSLIGILVERNSDAFKNKDGSLQGDKIAHSNVGALINLGGVTGAYLALETAGLGDRLGLSKTQKKWAILLTGTFMGMLAGYGKERFYDYYHPKTHTYDPHLKGDMGATWLGGGIFNVVTGPIAFEF